MSDFNIIGDDPLDTEYVSNPCRQCGSMQLQPIRVDNKQGCYCLSCGSVYMLQNVSDPIMRIKYGILSDKN